MLQTVKRVCRKIVRTAGRRIIRTGSESKVASLPPDFDPPAIQLVHRVGPYTMTSPERIYNLRESVRYVVHHNIPGDFVECGVWKGGSMMAIALTLIDLGVTDRRLRLYDTFDGMTAPTDNDVSHDGHLASDLRAAFEANGQAWCGSQLAEVRRAMESTGYPTDNIDYVKGRVEDTIPQHAPEQICLLRLDTDWYESTYHELQHLYPRLSPRGVMIIDDYGHWQGARKAVDQYVRESDLRLFLQRVDYTGRCCVKPAA